MKMEEVFNSSSPTFPRERREEVMHFSSANKPEKWVFPL